MLDLSKKNILLTGPPGVGKTTVIVRLVESLGKNADGFYTRELRESGRRTGFLLTSLDGTEGMLAHVDLKYGPKVGRYTVNLDDLDSVGTASIKRAVQARRIVVLDEIGRMELLSEGFKREVLRALDSVSRVVATIREGSDRFCDPIKEREDAVIVRVSESNREELPVHLFEALRSD
jgi:nucleoside-triphosphatase